MANRKIPELPELTSVANDDLFYVVDISDTSESAQGTSKKVKKSNLTPTLQQVLDNGNSASVITSTNTSSVGFLIEDGTAVEMYLNNTDVNNASRLYMNNDGALEMQKKIEGKVTSFIFETPLAETTIKVPAKIAGTYTLATLDDITGGSPTIVTKTKAEIDTLISGNDLVPLTVYEITGVDTALYGGSTIYLQAINDNILATDGIGKFFNPKYNQAVSGFEVWTSAGTYSIGDKVHWGGKTWENVDGNVGASTDLFTLDAEWSVIAFNDTDYNVAYDLIKYDYINDVIIYRNEQNSNIVSTNYDNIGSFYHNPIKVFMWGNTYDYDAYGFGIGSQIINNSYNENINFRGAYQIYLTFDNGSYQQNIYFDNVSYQQYLTFDNGSRQTDLIFDNSYQQYLTFDNYSYQGSLTFDNVSYQQYLTFDNGSNQGSLTFDNVSYQQYLTFDNGSNQGSLTFDSSYQQYLTFDNGSNQGSLTFDNVSYQQYLTFDNGSRQTDLIFDNGSSQQYLTFDNVSYQINLTETTGLFQSKLSFNNYEFDRTATPLVANEIGLIFNGTLPTTTTATKMIVAEDGQWKEMDVPTTTIADSFSATGTATTTFTVTIGTTQADSLYKVTASPSNVLSAVMFYINNKTTTTFDVVFVTGLTGAVAFDWILKP